MAAPERFNVALLDGTACLVLRRLLLWSAGLFLFAGTVAAWLNRSADGVEALVVGLRSQANQAWVTSPWSWGGWLLLILSTVVIGTDRLERWLLSRGARGRGRGQVRLSPGGSAGEILADLGGTLSQCAAARQPDIITIFDELLCGAARVAASDMHITPSRVGALVTYRVQGSLHEVLRVNTEVATQLVGRAKVLAELDSFVKNRAQDGRLEALANGIPMQARISIVPTESGERVVLRFVSGTVGIPRLADLGLPAETRKELEGLLAKSQGLLLLTGPVGSGKTTTLYASLRHISETRGRTSSIVTLEDPVECELPFASQTEISSQTGMTFASALRSVLRQDPNVLMIGEVRDPQSAAIAIQAGLSGHLILSSIHAQSAAGTFARLMEMEVDEYGLASAALGAISQRLCRLLCQHCRRERQPTEEVIRRFAALGVILRTSNYAEAVGCDRCQGEGYAERRLVAEILVVTEPLRAALLEKRPTSELESLARTSGMTPLLSSCVALAESGATSLDEILRVVG